MSLLMQALKKAEHSKQKKDVPAADTSSGSVTNPERRFEELSLSPMAERDENAAEPLAGMVEAGDAGKHRQGDADERVAQPPMTEPALAPETVPERYDPQPLASGEAVAGLSVQDAPRIAAASPEPQPAAEPAPTPQADAASAAAHVQQARRNAETARASIEAARQASEARQSAKAVFVAKQRPARGRALILVSSAVLLAAAGVGGYYVWQTTMQTTGMFPSGAVPLTQPAPMPAPVAATPASSAPAPQAEVTPASTAAAMATAPAAGNAPAASPGAESSHANLSGHLEKVAAVPAATMPDASDMQGEKSLIQIHHSSTVSRLNPALAHAYQLFQSGDLDAARRQYQTALRQEPNNRDALLGLAAIAVNHRQSAVAADYYSRLLELDPADPDAIAGLVSEQQGDPAQSESRLKKVLAADPQAGAVLFALGNLYAQQSRWADAQQAYFRAYVTAPDNANFTFNLAVSLDKLGQRKLALEYYRKALAQKDGNFDGAVVRKRADELQAALEQ